MSVSEDYCCTEENDRAAQTVVRNLKQKVHLRVKDLDGKTLLLYIYRTGYMCKDVDSCQLAWDSIQ